jgi:aminoglycoside/choline kinase family phosphotransferase
MTRDQEIAAFLADTEFAGLEPSPLAQDASFRRYWRLSSGTRSAVLMDAPPPEDVALFARWATYLRRFTMPVPEILKIDEIGGLLLEQDFGDTLISRYLSAEIVGPYTPKMIRVAANILVAWQTVPPPDFAPAWDAAAMTNAALGTLFDWWWPAWHGGPAPAQARAEVGEALRLVLAPVDAGPRELVHRDYFAGNLFWRQYVTPQVAVIDFQNASVGHPAYDLVSLLQDPRHPMAPWVEDRTRAYFLNYRYKLDRANFLAAYAGCAAQRHLRVACQWVRLAVRDKRPSYLAYGPRSWTMLTRALAEPAVAPLARALDRWVPFEHRANPKGLSA